MLKYYLYYYLSTLACRNAVAKVGKKDLPAFGPPGIKLEDRVGTLMWNSAWHMECLLAKICQVLACFARHMFGKVWV